MTGIAGLFRLSNERGSLGLSCNESGVALAGVPLLRRCSKGFVPRPRLELEHLLSRAYETEVNATSVASGLEVAARALNQGDMARAMVAAVQLKLPELDWHGAVRIAQADARLAKYNPDQPRDWHGRWTTGDSESPNVVSPVSLRPSRRRPVTPMPVGFIRPGADPASGFDDLLREPPLQVPLEAVREATEAARNIEDGLPPDWVRLPPGERNDEAGDLLEWIVNAKAEDEEAIKREIDRVFFNVGDRAGGQALLTALFAALHAGPIDRARREELLRIYEPYTKVDPSVTGAHLFAMTQAALLAPTRGMAPTAPKGPSEVWKLGWSARGFAINDLLGSELADNYPVIDSFKDSIALSRKSVELRAPTYQAIGRLLSRINRDLDKVAAFNGQTRVAPKIESAMIKGRAFDLVVPMGTATPAQKAAIERARARARALGVVFTVTEL